MGWLCQLFNPIRGDLYPDGSRPVTMVAVGHSLAGLSHQPAQSGLRDEQQQRIQALLAENDKLFTALNATAVEVANIRSSSQFERLDTLARLVSLAQTANQTGRP